MNDSNITREALPVNNENEFDEIHLDPHEECFQYTVVPNALIRDASISPSCRWLIIYLLSNKPGWTIKTKQLCAHTKEFMGRDRVRKTLNEAIDAGYINRETLIKGNLRGFRYVVSSSPKFKKFLRRPEIQVPEVQCTEFQGPENQGIKEVLSKEVLSLKNTSSLKVSEKPSAGADACGEISSQEVKKPKIKPSKEFSPQVKEITQKMIQIVIKYCPVYRPPIDLAGFHEAVSEMVEKDKQDVDVLLKTFEWGLSDNEQRDSFNGWQGILATNKKGRFISNPAKIFQSHFSKIHSQMRSKPRRSFAPCSNDERSYEKMEEWSKKAL